MILCFSFCFRPFVLECIKCHAKHLTISVPFLSTESLFNLQIHLLKSEVAVGSDAEFNCTTSNPINKNLSTNMILAFLIKNEKPFKVNIWDTKETMTTFTLREVRMEDAGTYSCAILLNILHYHGMRLDRNNTVDLQIVGKNGRGRTKPLFVWLMCL